MKMFAGHELKVLNLSVIVYIILGALIFHSLGEFDRRPTATTKFTTTTTSQRHNKSPNLSNGQQQHQQQVTPAPTDKGPAGRQTGSPNDKSSSAVVVANHHANRQDALARLQLIRLNSVRRMWNITNQLNILYESNWTELVLNELVNYERQFLESLERLAGEQSGDGDDNDDGGDYYYDGDDGPEDKHDNDDDGLGEANDEDKEKKKQKADETGTKKRRRGGDDRGSSGSSSAKRDSSVEHRVRLESIKKSLVHSLATITTMGSPIKPPESPLGRLLTILYGSLGIPLLVVTVAKSGQHLARTSLNGLLVLRHYCFALPLHYLCCSCNLFVCLRWLSWCCCCCCCSYLCCLADNKQKCCDYGNAPKLKLHKSGQAKSSGRSRRRAGSQQRAKTATQQTNKPPTLAETVNEGADQTGSGGGATTFVIGFNMNLQQELAANKSNKSEKQLAKVDQQKSVRFKGDPDSHYDSDQSSSSAGSSSSNPRLDEPEDQDPIDENEAWRLLISSLMVLVAYLAAGAYYHARQQNVPLVESLFTCYSMLATAKLPDSFNLDSQPQPLPPTTNPLQFYRAHLEEVSSRSSTGTPLARLERPSQQQEPQLASQMIQTHTSEPPQPSKTKPVVGDELTLIMDSIYLLIGLNLIAACAQFGRLWFDGTVKRRFKKACCHKLSPLSHLNCNGSSTNQVSASTSLMGSFEHQTSGGGVGQFVANQSLMGPTITSSHYDKQFSLAGLAPPSAVAATTGSVGGPADPIPLSTQNNPISLGELFVLGPDSGGPHDSSQPASSSPVSNYHSHHQQQLQQQQQQQLSDGASFASSSSQAGPRSAGSLCAHHQSTLVLQALAVNQPLDRQGCYSSSQHIHISSAEPTSPDEHQGPHHQHQHRHRNCYDSQANNMNIEHHDQQLLHQQQQHHSNSHHNHHQHHHHHQAELSDGSSQAGSANNNTKMRHSSSSIQLFEVPALLDGHEHAAAPNNQAYNPSPGYNSTATLTRRSHHNHNYSHNNQQHKDDNGHYSSSSSTNHHHHRPHDGGRTSASQTLGAVPLLPLTNGFAGNLNGTAGAGGHSSHNEQDSSPNTFDTNSQTMSSSMSSRAIVMKPIRGQQQQSMTKTTSSAGGNGEKTVSWLQSNNSGH